MHHLKSLLVAAALLLCAGLAAAQGMEVGFGGLRIEPDLPVEVTADQLDVDQQTGEAVFSGNVLISQGEMRLSAQRVEVIYAQQEGRIARMEATGGVTLVSGQDAAEAARAEYSIEDGTILMSGDVLLTQGSSAISAEEMTVDLTAGTARMTGRVRTLLQTGSD